MATESKRKFIFGLFVLILIEIDWKEKMEIFVA
jgi:hypothetical protein